MQVTTEDLFKAACWRHAKAQDPWVVYQVAYWQGVANGLALVLRQQGLNDRQLSIMEEDGIELGARGRWDGLLEALDKPDGTVPHED